MSRKKGGKRRSGKRVKQMAAGAGVGAQVVAGAGLDAEAYGGGFGGWSGYQGASYSTDRGQVFWPTLETRKELDQFTRQELQRRVRWLVANVGFIKGMVQNAASLVGYLTPNARTQDRGWKLGAREVFRERMMRAGQFDLGGKFNFATAQVMINERRFQDGALLTVLVRRDKKKGPRVAFYESHQLASPKGASKSWQDGVLVGKHGVHLAYGVRDGERGKVVVIPAKHCIYSGKFSSPGHVHSVPPLAHAVNHAIDVTEVWGFTKAGIKTSSLFGAVIERDGAGTQTPRSQQGLVGGARVSDGGVPGGPRMTMNDVMDGPVLRRMERGEKMKVLHDGRPSPNQQEFCETLVRDMAVGFGLQPEVIWRMMKLTGPGVRFVMDVADRWIQEQQRVLADWAGPVWAFFMADAIESGEMGFPSDGAKFWRAKLTPQRNLTIDRGQVSRARLAEIDAGVATWESWEEVDGEGWEERMEQRIEEYVAAKKRCEKAGVSYEEVFGRRAGVAAVESDEPKGGEGKGNDKEEDE